MVKREWTERKYPCLGCGVPIAPSRATYLFSVSHSRNVGPFHRSCAARLTVDDEDNLWRNERILLAAAHTYGPTNEQIRLADQ